ncbi:hypothetical protein PHISCL_03614 [Aspergillus sclerotialis]|uniref:Uncharacterized protein n=1 Tax=Aspergillus sclerotialis TaxID=2070753 RepID=A0A3A2ZN50_9EURO|nr:hypothetical protein PHISCL_03614 [Aspergillus sclerotialis]
MSKLIVPGRSNLLIRNDIRLREIVQRETFLIEEREKVEERAKSVALTDTEKIQLKNWCEELEELNKDYWRQERGLYILEASGRESEGPFNRAYESYRSDPYWYLHPWLKSDCAGKGGCCGCGCGCCERDRSKTRVRCRGHCTAMCGCCQRTRGFEIKRGSEDYRRITYASLSKNEQDTLSYCRNMMRGYFWGY